MSPISNQKRQAAFVAIFLFTLAACGGGGGGAGAGGSSPSGQARSGILTDSEVAGVAYASSPSGKTGVTTAQGAYDFNEGDTVQFSLGSLLLGNVAATGIVTPTELAAGNSNKLHNLLVVLQSLDADGNPSNGISIPSASAAAVTTDIDLTVAPASLNTSALQDAMTAGGISSPIVTQTDADAHYLSQGMSLLSSNIWVSQPANNPVTASTIFLRFAANGEYLHGQAQAPAPGDSGMTGVEYGTATLTEFDVHGFKIPTPSSIVVDTNGEWGMSHPLFCDRWRSVGDRIIFTEDRTTPSTCENSTVLDTTDKVDNNPTGIVGVWADSATAINVLHMVFFADGTFFAVDPIGDTNVPGCGGPGVEAGSYTFNATTGALDVSNATFDTNGCVGFFDNSVPGTTTPIIIAPDGNSATMDGTFTIYRVSN